jgi:hypothetical protein
VLRGGAAPVLLSSVALGADAGEAELLVDGPACSSSRGVAARPRTAVRTGVPARVCGLGPAGRRPAG